MPDETTSSETATAADLMYGGYALRRDDRDSDIHNSYAPRWGGQDGAGPYAELDPIENPIEVKVNLNATSTIAFPSYVRELQYDLHTLGFGAIREETGLFDLPTEWAVREFQIYAGMEQVAREPFPWDPEATTYLERLEQVENGNVYEGPISGVVNEETRQCIRHWKDNNYRCPVVIQARTRGEDGAFTEIYDGGGMAEGAEAENLWRHDDLQDSSPRVFVRDFTDYYDFEGTGHDPDEMIVLGDYQTYLEWRGPRSKPPIHTWNNREITSGLLVGTSANELSEAQASTFRAIRPVSESECWGFFDSVNSYDNAFVSMGPCHWTLAIVSPDGLLEGEFCGYLAYLCNADEEAFDEAVERFGARVSQEWRRDGSALFDSTQRKYTGWMALQQPDSSFAEISPEQLDMQTPELEEEYNYFKTWHWFYRWMMAARTIEGFRRRMWDMARVRLRDILETSWGPSAPRRWPEGVTIGEVFTSEKAASMILRWHVRYPTHMVHDGAGEQLQEAFGRARETSLPPSAVSWDTDPAGWTDAHEAALVQGLIDEVAQTDSENLRGDIQDRIDDWPAWLEEDNPRGFELQALTDPLSEERGSFELDRGELPPAP